MVIERVSASDPAERLGGRRRTLTCVVGALLLLMASLLAAGNASAATVSGALRGGLGYQVVLVQGDGVAGEVTITRASGAFTLRTARLARATLHLVKSDGSYYGPVVLKATRDKDFCTFKGAANLRLGALSLKGGYAIAARAPAGRFDIRLQYTVTARRGKPIGAGKAGRVGTGKPAGLRGEGGDLDRDGVVGAFDIDDNGNLILDNADRTGRGEMRPSAFGPARAAVRAVPGDIPPGPEPEPRFGVFSNFRLPGGGGDQDVRINANIPGIQDVEGLIDTYLPQTLLLVMRVMGDGLDGSTATLDGLGNEWVREHVVDAVTYPQIEIANGEPLAPAGHSLGPDLLDLVAGTDRGGDAFIFPGAVADQVSPGDAFVETAADGTKYPGVVNFAFNTVPAVKSYRFGDGAETEMVYDAQGVPGNRSLLPVPRGATTVTLTCWRPQRKAAAGESGSFAGDWVDIGKLEWEAPPLGTGFGPQGETLPGTSTAEGIFVSATANAGDVKTSISIPANAFSILDPAVDAAANPENTISITLDFTRMYSDWASFPAGSQVEIDLGARAAFGDLASSRIRFELR